MIGGRANLSVPALFLGYSVALLGGALLGFSSCGGYGWHKEALLYALLALALLLLAFPIRPFRTMGWRLPAAFALFPVAYLARASGAAYYNGSDLISGYLSDVWFALTYGPC